ncbi:MAG: hypothetical protein KC592_01990 [Nitrospira sp.]|nr:hypothetical protein [Nitrospira sp.]
MNGKDRRKLSNHCWKTSRIEGAVRRGFMDSPASAGTAQAGKNWIDTVILTSYRIAERAAEKSVSAQ